MSGNAFALWYAWADKLQADPDDRDGLMAMGGFYETLRLAGAAAGLRVELQPAWSTHRSGLTVGSVVFAAGAPESDPLAASIGSRQCNRNPYSTSPIPAGIAVELEALGHVLMQPRAIARLVGRASASAWKDRRFVSDLEQWTRFDDRSTDGMTVDCLQLGAVDRRALKVALRLGRLPAAMARVYASRDVRLTRASGAIAVLIAPDREPATMFGCGRILIRSWTLINALGYAWHPMSVVIDQPTVTALRSMLGGNDPVAVYRVGYTDAPAAWSKRRPLSDVLVAPPV